MTIVKYLNPKNDIAFKKIFGTEKNKLVLKHFLNDVLAKTGEDIIKEVTLLNPMQYPESVQKKQSIIDVLCVDESGVQYIVEMQVAKVAGFEKRAQFYAAKAYSNQAREGTDYSSLKEIIFLAITDFIMFKNKKGYKSRHVVLDKESYEHDLKDFSFTFIELPKFHKEKIEDLTTYEEKWYYFFKHAHEPENIEKLVANSDEVIKRAYEELKVHNWNDEELRAYEASEKLDWDSMARESCVRAEAEAKGMAEGIEKGIEKGMAEGIVQGKAEGEINKAKEVAKKLLLSGMAVRDVASIVDLEEAEVEKLK